MEGDVLVQLVKVEQFEEIRKLETSSNILRADGWTTSQVPRRSYNTGDCLAIVFRERIAEILTPA
jgi:hypothetical protein